MSNINMSGKQLETTANPETYQVDGGQLRPDPEMPSDGKLQPRDAGHSQHEAFDVPDRNSRETNRLSGESRQVQPNPEAKADGHSDAQSAIREPSDGDGDTMRTEGSGISERKSVSEGPLPDIRRERDSVRDIGIGKMAYFVVHDNRGSLDAHCESGGIAGRSPMTGDQSTSHDPLEKDRDRLAVSKGRGGTRCLGDDGLVTASSSDPEQGYSSDSLLLPDARKKGRLYLQVAPVITKSRRSTVWYVQPAPRGRDIFEAGGDESQNPRLKPLGGVVQDGSDRIEGLPVEESPVVETTPVASVATSRSWTDSLETAMFVPLSTCLCFLWRRLGVQFAKAPIFYVLSAIVVFFALVAFFGNEEDLDILMCVLATVAACIILTVSVPRGVCAKVGDELESVFLSRLASGLCSECCSRREQTPQPSRRHSKYYHPLQEEAHTAFEHEVADVSNIDPKDYPQMRMVDEQEILKSESPDFPPDFRQLNVDIHAPGSPRNSEEVEEAVPRKQGAIKKLAKTRTKSKSKSATAPLKPPKNSKAEEVPIPQIGQPEDLSNADLTRNISETYDMSSTLKSTLTSLIFETAAAYNAKEFVCEHDGQGVACSCFADRRKQND